MQSIPEEKEKWVHFKIHFIKQVSNQYQNRHNNRKIKIQKYHKCRYKTLKT